MTIPELGLRQSAFLGRTTRVLAASALAWAALGLGAGAQGQSFVAATEVPNRAPTAASSSWFNPFSWTNNETKPAATPTRRSSVPASAPPTSPRRSLASLNPFAWTNATGPKPTNGERLFASPPKPTAPVVSDLASQPPQDIQAAVATDGPVQPNSVQQASAMAWVNSLRPAAPRAAPPEPTQLEQPINWPPASHLAQSAVPPTPVVQASANLPIPNSGAGQGVNPLNWTNATPTTYDDFGTNRVPLEQQPLGQAMVAARQPMQWSNDPRGQAAPQEFMPPQEKSFGAAFEESLHYVQPGGDGRNELARSLPPVGATDAQMIEWEKENLPFTRPFYASNDPQHEIPFHPSEARGSSASELDLSVLGRPFTMSNNPQPPQPRRPAPQPQPQSQPTFAPDVSRDTRRVAYLENGEELPQPTQAAADPNSAFSKEGKGTLAEAEKIGEEPPESNTLQFLRADTVLLDPGQWQFDYGFTYTKFDSDFPIFITDGMGVAVTDAEFRIREFQVPFELRYGLARRVQTFLHVPFGWANTELTFPSFEEFENDGGLGDITFGATFLLREHDQCRPDAILTVSSTAPTGDDPFAPSAGASPSAPSLGTGAWSLASNLLFIQNYDPIVVFYGFGTRQYFLTEINGVNFRPGQEYNYQMGVGFAVNSSVTFSTRFNGAYITEAKLGGERIRGTISEPMTLTVAMTMAKCEKLIEPFVDFGLTDDAVDARIGITWTR